MTSSFGILLGGPLAANDRVLSLARGRRFIAADSGIMHARKLGITPELWVGDFDSADKDHEREWHHVPTRRYPQEKDRTDGELAVAEAIEAGARDMVLFGALSGARSDHFFAHLALALSLAENGMPVVLTSGAEEATPLSPGRTEFDYPEGTLFSVISFRSIASISITGAKWPLSNAAVRFASTLTLSNVVNGPLQVEIDDFGAVLLARTAAAL